MMLCTCVVWNEGDNKRLEVLVSHLEIGGLGIFHLEIGGLDIFHLEIGGLGICHLAKCEYVVCLILWLMGNIFLYIQDFTLYLWCVIVLWSRALCVRKRRMRK